jgi:hypothetical protein
MWDEIDLNNYDPESVQRAMESGGLLPPGYYFAVLDGANSVTSKSSDLEGQELTFRVTAGPYKDQQITDTLWKPDPTKAAMVNRALLFQHRLGLIARDDSGKKFVRIEGKHSFADCLDTTVIISVKHETYPKKDKKGVETGERGTAARLEFNGVHAIDDPKSIEKANQTIAEQSSGTEPPPAASTANTPKPTPPKPATSTATTAPKSATEPAAKKRFDTSKL